MNEIIVINGQSVEFEVADSGVFATSLDVANVFEKRHADIIAKIAELPADSFRERNFSLTERTAKFGAVVRSEPYYKISRDGFSLLVMGFTGEKAYRWKIEFINAFNKMEAMIKNGNVTNDKFTEVLTALKDKSNEADEFKSKYYAAIERENMLLRQNFQAQGDMVKKSSRLSESEKDEIIRLYKSGLSQGEICRRMVRFKNAIDFKRAGLGQHLPIARIALRYAHSLACGRKPSSGLTTLSVRSPTPCPFKLYQFLKILASLFKGVKIAFKGF